MPERVDLATFESRHGGALAASMVEHSRFAFILPRLKAANGSGHDTRLWSAGEGTACALFGRGTLVLGDLDNSAIDAIVQDALSQDVRQIGGPERAVGRAVERCTQAGAPFSVPLVMRTMVLRQKPVARSTEGRGRLADPHDYECVRRWLADFQREALRDQETASQSAQDVRCRILINADSVLLWEHDNAPVSMAVMVQDLPQIAALSLVYTPPRWRGHGYAGAAVSLLSTRIVESGRPACLYVNAANPISTRCYAKVGYVAAVTHANAYRVVM